MTETTKRSAWGRAKFGGGSATLITVSLISGAALAAGLSYLYATFQFPENFATAWSIFGAVFWPIMSVIVWVLLVDRSTLRGAPKNPEASIEATWYSRAAAGAFTDLIGALGLGLLVTTLFVDVPLPTDNVLLAILLVATVDFTIRYVVLRLREG